MIAGRRLSMSKKGDSEHKKQKDIRMKKRLLKDFGFIITPEIDDLFKTAKNEVQRENLVLGLIHDKLDKKDAQESQKRIEDARRKRFGGSKQIYTKEIVL